MVDWKQAPIPEPKPSEAAGEEAATTGAQDFELSPAPGSDGPLGIEPGTMPMPDTEELHEEAVATIEAIESFDPLAMLNEALGVQIPPVVLGIVALIIFFLLMIFAFAPRTPSEKELEKYRPDPSRKQAGPT